MLPKKEAKVGAYSETAHIFVHVSGINQSKETEGSPFKASGVKKVVSPVNTFSIYDPALDKCILMGVF